MDKMAEQDITTLSVAHSRVRCKKSQYLEGFSIDNVSINYKPKRVYSFFKRIFDVASSFVFLVIFGWLILLLMLIKALEDAGVESYKLVIAENKDGKYLSKNGKRYDCKVKRDPGGEKDDTVHGPIYTSIRVGKNGRLFKFHKIRSMCPGAEKMKAQLLEYGINEADEPAFKIKDDPRITKFGRFIRRTSLDELPQIWDIFVGRISVVGPRPPLVIEVKEYDDKAKQRLLVKGGLLCLWQIQHNRNTISFDDWVDLDTAYIEKRSVGLDLKIIFKDFGWSFSIEAGNELRLIDNGGRPKMRKEEYGNNC